MKIIEIEHIFNKIHVKVDVTKSIMTFELDNIKGIEDFKAKLKVSVAAAIKGDERKSLNETLFTNINKMVGEEMG